MPESQDELVDEERVSSSDPLVMSMRVSSVLSSAELNEIADRASRVRSLMQRSAAVWLSIAQEVNAAKRTLSKSAFDMFLQQSSLTQSIADKMPRIARASILYLDESKPHLEKLEGWTTLYEVSKLSDAETREMYSELSRNPDQPLTREFVAQFRQKKSRSQSRLLNIATVALSEDDISRLDYDEYLRFRDDLDAIQRIIDRSVLAATIAVNASALATVEAKILSRMSSPTDSDTPTQSDDTHFAALTAANI